ncbi:MAG: hypothetical protein AB7P11_15310 [Hydrogenophaga sp.]
MAGMPVDLEACYLSIEWLGPGIARRIEAAPEPLELLRGDDGVLRLQTQIFRDHRPWLGLRLTGVLADVQPKLVDAQGGHRPLLALPVPKAPPWWVVAGDWDAVRARHFSELHRSLGQFEVQVGEQHLFIENLSNGLDKADIEAYLGDFKGELIWLVLGTDAATTARAGSSTPPYDERVSVALETFTTAAERVRSNAAQVLREIQAPMPRVRLRPNGASFRQHVRTPTSRLLPGRVLTESSDLPDNRYLRHLLQTGVQLAKALGDSAQAQATRLVEHSQHEERRREEYLATRSQKVSPETFDRQQRDAEERYATLVAWTDDRHQNSAGAPPRTVQIVLRNPVVGVETDFFYDKPGGRDDGDDRYGIDYNRVSLPSGLARLMKASLHLFTEYTLTGVVEVARRQSQKHRDQQKAEGVARYYRQLNFHHVFEVRLGRAKLERRQVRRDWLEQHDWMRALSSNELQEMQQEARTAGLRAQTFEREAARAAQTHKALADSLDRLRQEDRQWAALGVAVQAELPVGMRYSLNPDYAAVLKAWRQVEALADEGGLGAQALLTVERIGVLHASAVYERWCLIKLIALLVQDLGFVPRPGWQADLLKAVTGRPVPVSLHFHHAREELTAQLDVQVELPNGRRPDMRLCFRSGQLKTWLVMDAKFRSGWRTGELPALLAELVEAKDYGQGRDRVFILQPQPFAAPEPSSPLVWAEHSDYGHDDPIDHKFGHIQLAAGTGNLSTRYNLWRLLALGLQQVFPAPTHTVEKGWNTASICIRCGLPHDDESVKPWRTSRQKDAWGLHCRNCRAHSFRTHCYACNRPLFKNGVAFTYHRTLADQINNVACPSCGNHFDQELPLQEAIRTGAGNGK